MKFTILKDILEEKMSYAARFTLSKISSVPLLQGGRLDIKDDSLEITTTNLNEFFYTILKIEAKGTSSVIIDLKKIIEFLSFLPSGKIEVEIKENQLIIQNDKTRGAFNTADAADFPTLPQIEGKKHSLKKTFLNKHLPLILFAAAGDETRPILTGVNFKQESDHLYIVATDGFRLSLITEKDKESFSTSVVISARVLGEVIRLLGKNEEVEMVVSNEEKMIKFTIGDINIYTRAVEGDFPPFQRVIPETFKTKLILDKEEFLRNIKLASVFARELSNVIIFQIKKDGLYIRPKTKKNEDTEIYQGVEFEGEEQTISFNYKFILDFLNNVNTKKIIFEMTEKNAPGVFKISDNKNFLHVIMPVRTDDEAA